jgi:hypothetical protein
VFFFGDKLVDGFVHWAAPINFWKQMDEMDAQRGGDQKQVIIGDAEQSRLDFGDGAASGIMPARELQLDGEVFLRPAMMLAQLANLLSNQVFHYHFNPVAIIPLVLPENRRTLVSK